MYTLTHQYIDLICALNNFNKNKFNKIKIKKKKLNWKKIMLGFDNEIKIENDN